MSEQFLHRIDVRMSQHSHNPDDPEAYTGETILMRTQRDTRPMPRPTPGGPRRPRRPAGRRFPLKRLVLGLLALLVLGVLLAYMQLRGLAGDVVLRDLRPAMRVATPMTGMNMLLIGVDERNGQPEEGVRSDTLIVAHLDASGRWISLLSLPRDSIVVSSQLGETKINAIYGYAYANAEALYGPGAQPREAGMAMAAESVEQFTGLPIHAMAQVNFEGFAGIVDALGGVSIDVPSRIIDDEYPTSDFGVMRIEFEPGRQTMSGERALIYARTRHADSDFGRSARQQQVMAAIGQKLRGRGPLGMLFLIGPLRDALAGSVATSLQFDRPDLLMQLAWLASGLNADSIGRLQLTPETAPGVQEIGSDLYWNTDQVHALAQRLLVRPSPAAEEARVQVLNGTSIQGLAGRVSLELEAQGFVLLPADDAPATARTTVYDSAGKPATSRRIAQLLNADLRQGMPQGITSEAEVIVVLGEDYR